MKKILALITVIVMSLSLASCSLFDVRNSPKKTFEADGMSITLTTAFSEEDYEGYTACYDSHQVAVFVLKEDVDDFEDGLTLEEYADLLVLANADSGAEKSKEKDMITMEYEAVSGEDNEKYTYFGVVYEGSDAFWMVQFVCKSSKYEDFKPDFIKWAESVSFAK